MSALGIVLNASFVIVLTLPTELVESRLVGSVSGIILSIGYIGGVVGPWVSGYIRDLTGDFFHVLVILTLVAVVATFLTFLLPETGRKKTILSSDEDVPLS